jgi:hypothetical protein
VKFSTKGLWVAVFFTLAILLCAGSVWAQTGASSIRGTVTDASDAVVPNATVTITNLQTNLTRTQTTTALGTFGFELIPIGDYKLEVQAQGFKKQVVSPVHALVGGIAEVPVQLAVGELTAVVQVEATSTVVAINTQDATLGNNFVALQIQQLPLESRNVVNLLTLQAGVTGSPDAQGYVAGARSDQSNVTLDGVDINEAQTGQITGGGSQSKPVLRLNAEAIEEFRVNTINANSTQGRSSGAQISLVTKSGTNNWHGAAFESYRSTGFTANNFFFNRGGKPRPPLIRHTYGGAVGGPVIKDKVFFFYSFEGRIDRSSAPSDPRVVPLPNLGQGNLNATVKNCATCPTYSTVLTAAQLNGIFPAVGLNPAALTALAAAAAAYPANDTTAGDGLNTSGFRFSSPTPVDLRSNVAKIDWVMSNSMTVSVRLNAIFDLTGRLPQFPDTPAPNLWEHPYGGVVNHNWTINKNWVNSFRYGLTRTAFSSQGDSAGDAISFRFVFSPRLFNGGTGRTLARTTPVHNFVDDVSWIRGNHTFQFGTNIRITRNTRNSFSAAYDSAITNPSFYAGGGNAISNPVRDFLRGQLGQTPAFCQDPLTPPGSCLTIVSNSSVQNAVTAMIGRFSQYSGNFTFDIDGKPLAAGSPSARTFATEDYDMYFQDTWKMTRNITLTAGLRYSLGRPVYEMKGFEVKPSVPLDKYFAQRRAAELLGTNYVVPLQIDLSGPANGKSPLYHWDKNNFQPRVAVAWSPHFENKLLKGIFGAGGKSVIRGGFAISNDYYGQSLAVAFDLNNTLGFTGNTTISANTFNVTSNPAPLFTGFNQDARSLPGITAPAPVTFPATPPIHASPTFNHKIESSLDEGLTAPVNYQFSLTIERELPKGLVIQASYLGRMGRKLLATRDIMALSNLKDPASKQDWYTAGTILEKLRQLGTPISGVSAVPWFENMLPANYVADMKTDYMVPANLGGYGFTAADLAGITNKTQAVYFQAQNVWANDWTDTQAEMEIYANKFLFFNPQWGALSSWGTIARSNYNALTFSVRQRLRDISWDLNYTFSHSLDDASGLQTSTTYDTSFILNPIRQGDNYGHSDFDIRQQINVNSVFTLPFGSGKRFGSGVSRGVDAVIGGWQLSGIWRWNTGAPIFSVYDDARWATNWNAQSGVFQTKKFAACPTRGDAATAPKLFGCDPTAAYRSFRNAYPGETGPRNPFRLPGYVNLDLGLSKRFVMPFNEKHVLQLRWEVFNVTNTQRMGSLDSSRTGFGIGDSPALNSLSPEKNFSNFQDIQGSPRVMQIGLRYSF